MRKNKSLCILSLAISLCCVQNSYADVTPIIQDFSNTRDGVPSLAPLVEKVIPAVVNISVNGKKTINNDIMIPEQFRFFMPDIPKERAFSALGSGVIIDKDKGYVITNFHVIDGANEIKITLHDGRTFLAEKKGEDRQTDFALLQLKDFSNLTEIPFANSDNLKVGDFAIAIGNPFGLGQTVTSGIISALGRSGLNIENYENFIQTDAAINSGNSGGALINLKGELIGINTAILGNSGGNIGIGFAIPSNMIKSILKQLLDHGSIKRGLLGILGSEVTEELAKNFEYKNVNGAFVNEVQKDSAADKAGIKPGDIINTINGVPISNFGQLRAKIATLGAGANVKLGIFRNGNQIELNATLDSDSNIQVLDYKNTIIEGASFKNNGNGVEVTDVKTNSPAYRLNIKKGDIIVEVNKKTIKNTNDLSKALSTNSKFIALKILRGNTTVYITRNY
ncbi:MAG: DegQ family serine endoprotease [Succinivibrionaceae bacterium]